MRFDHLAQIGFRLSLFAFIVGISIILGSFLSFFIVAIIAIFGFLLPFITLGLPFIMNPHYFEDLSNLLSNTNSVINFFWGLTYYFKYVAIAGIIGSIIGMILLLIDKNNKQWGKFVFCIISAVACLLLFIFIASGTFNQGVIS